MFMMDDGVDTGLIAAQEEVKISDNDDINTLYKKIEDRVINNDR